MREKILKKIELNKENLRKVENAIKEDHWKGDKYFNGILNRNSKMLKVTIWTEEKTVKGIDKTKELFNKFKNWVNK